MSVHRLKDGRWYANYYPPGERRGKRKYFGRGAEAKRNAQAWDLEYRAAKAKAGRNGPPPDDPAFLDLAQRYVTEHQLADSSRRDIVWNLNRHAADLFGRKPVSRLTMADLADLNAAMAAQGLSLATRNRLRSYCRAILGWAVNNELIDHNPFAKFRPDRQKEGHAPALISDAELRALWDAAAPHLRWAVYCMLNLGVRPGPSELLAIRMADVDHPRRGIWVTRGKTWSHPALIPVTDAFLSAVRELAAREPGRQYLVEYDGRPVRSLRTAWYAALRRAGIYEPAHRHGRNKHAKVAEQPRRLRLYDLRHLFATRLLASGADLKAASVLLGHASPDLTLRTYYHLVDGQTRQAVDRHLHLPDLPDPLSLDPARAATAAATAPAIVTAISENPASSTHPRRPAAPALPAPDSDPAYPAAAGFLSADTLSPALLSTTAAENPAPLTRAPRPDRPPIPSPKKKK